MAGLNPARLLNFETIELKPGSRADLVFFHHDGRGHPLKITATLFQGAVRFGTLPG